jgi:hypothetical protein
LIIAAAWSVWGLYAVLVHIRCTRKAALRGAFVAASTVGADVLAAVFRSEFYWAPDILIGFAERFQFFTC